jgi:hypothetical protein
MGLLALIRDADADAARRPHADATAQAALFGHHTRRELVNAADRATSPIDAESSVAARDGRIGTAARDLGRWQLKAPLAEQRSIRIEFGYQLLAGADLDDARPGIRPQLEIAVVAANSGDQDGDEHEKVSHARSLTTGSAPWKV